MFSVDSAVCRLPSVFEVASEFDDSLVISVSSESSVLLDDNSEISFCTCSPWICAITSSSAFTSSGFTSSVFDLSVFEGSSAVVRPFLNSRLA